MLTIVIAKLYIMVPARGGSVVSLRFRKDSILIMDDKYRHLREWHELPTLKV